MQYAYLIGTLVSASLVLARKAPVIKDKSTRGVVALADFPAGYDEKVLGVVKFTNPSGTVKVHVDMTGLPASGGPFYYHIHKDPMPDNGDCLATSTHFNPYDAPADCDSQKNDAYCQVGDLSGKHGWINTTCFAQDYDDKYLSLNPKSPSYIVGKSINFHFANNTRFACANINLVDEVDQEAIANIEADTANGAAIEEILLGLEGENQPLDDPIDVNAAEGIRDSIKNIEIEAPLKKIFSPGAEGSAVKQLHSNSTHGNNFPSGDDGENDDEDNDDSEPDVNTTDSVNGAANARDGVMAGMAIGLFGILGAIL